MRLSKPSLRNLLSVPLAFATLLAVGGAAPIVGVVRSITAGFGLTGGGTGDVALAVDTALIQRRVGGVCGVGQAISAIQSNGSVTCRPVGTPVTAFVHKATTETIPEAEPGVSIIDNELINGDPSAIVLVTARLTDPGATNFVDSHPIAVTYITTATCPGCDPVFLEKWLIIHGDNTVIPVGAEYNVLIVKK